MKLYIVQAEEGSGIPGVPEVYTSEEAAAAAYKEAWREAWGPDEDDIDEIMAGDFDADWPEDGGVRMWVVEVDLAPIGQEVLS